MNFNFNPNEYTARNFPPIPEGDHKVMINNVEEKVFSTGSEGFKITLDVAGFESKLWYHLVINPEESAKTNQRLGMFFDSFAIKDYDLSHYSNWIGNDGAVRVKHDIYNGSKSAKVVFCLSRSQQGNLYTQQANPFTAKASTSNINPERKFNGFSF